MARRKLKQCPGCSGKMDERSLRCRHCAAAGTTLQAEIIHGYEQGEPPSAIAARTQTSIWCVYNLASRLRSRGLLVPYARRRDGANG